MRRIALPFVGLAAIAGGSLGWPVAAQAPGTAPAHACGQYDDIASQLGQHFSEIPKAFGLQQNGHLIQVFVSEETGTWTIVSTTPAGVSCIVAAGKSWETLPISADDSLA